MSFNIFVAKSGRVIGSNGTIPWYCPKDLQRFKQITMGKTIIMGRKTWDSLPRKPLPGRINVVISRQPHQFDNKNVIFSDSLQNALDISYVLNNEIFVIGGSEIYKQALKHSHLDKIFITEIKEKFDGDTYFPKLDSKFRKIMTQDEDTFTYKIYHNHDEYQYLDLIRNIIDNGEKKCGTLTLSGNMMKFNLQNSFPLLTTKRVFWKGVVEELLWFIKGSTECRSLNNKGVKIWNPNSKRDFLDSRGLNEYNEGELGPIYGFQWRNFGADYVSENNKNKEELNFNFGIDQLTNVIKMIKEEPNSRRIILNSWNAKDIDKMALPPCHVMCQFLVNNGELTCIMYQRSADMGLGVPFNIASYSLLTYLIASVTNTKPKEFIHYLADTHIYEEHIEALEKQLLRTPNDFPTIKINKRDNIDDFTVNDIKLINYNPHEKIKMPLIVKM